MGINELKLMAKRFQWKRSIDQLAYEKRQSFSHFPSHLLANNSEKAPTSSPVPLFQTENQKKKLKRKTKKKKKN